MPKSACQYEPLFTMCISFYIIMFITAIIGSSCGHGSECNSSGIAAICAGSAVCPVSATVTFSLLLVAVLVGGLSIAFF